MDYVVRKLEVTDDKQHPGLAAVSKIHEFMFCFQWMIMEEVKANSHYTLPLTALKIQILE